MRHSIFVVIACALGCSKDSTPAPQCDLDPHVAIDVHAGAVQTDGSVTVFGGVRFEPLVGDPDAGTDVERAVYAVYVADQEVQPAAGAFNFRTWTVHVGADVLAAFTTMAADGSKQAKLPVRAYLQGACTVELTAADEPVVKIPSGSGSGSGSGT